jgi:quercetin dioxygenase-like cupin family protein
VVNRRNHVQTEAQNRPVAARRRQLDAQGPQAVSGISGSEATEGRVGGTIGRAIKKFEPGGGAKRHYHNTGFHLIFVMQGWFRTEFEGLGEVVVRQGDCIAYQGEIPQEHIEYSDDFEVMQIASPADYGTENIES